MTSELGHRFLRLLKILDYIRENPGQMAEQLAEHFGQSKRNLYRDLKLLEEAGFPVKSDRGYRLEGPSPVEFGLAPASGNADVELVCRVEKNQADRLRKAPVHSSQEIHGDRLSLRVPDADAFVDWLLGHPGVELIEPIWLRRSLRRRAQELAERYA